MRRAVPGLLAFGLGFALALAMPKWLAPPPVERPPPPDMRTVVDRMRDVARLETLQVNVHRKVQFEQEAPPAQGTWGDLANWVRTSVRPVNGRAIVFGVAHVGVEIAQVNARLVDGEVQVVVPGVVGHVELRPEETEVVAERNMDTAQMAQMLALAKVQMERETLADPRLKERATTNARRALESFLRDAGFQRVRFVTALPASSS